MRKTKPAPPVKKKASPPVKLKANPKPRPAAAVKTLSKDLVAYRDCLLAEKARLEADRAEILGRAARAGEGEIVFEISSESEHPADVASETFEREKDLAIGENVENLLLKVKEALHKIEIGTYGVCDSCGKPIKRARLEALPFATFCVDCQEKMEFR